MAYVEVNDLDLWSEVSGHGDPVLVLHAGFCSLEPLRPLTGALAQDRRVAAYERPGHGRTADIDGEYDYATDAATALAYLDAHHLQRVHVVGHSDGGIIGLLLAIHHPARVRSLVAVSANLNPAAFSPQNPTERSLLLSSDTPPDAAPLVDGERVVHQQLSPDGPDHAEIVLAKLVRLWSTQPDIRPNDLARITAPTLVIAGDRDSVPPAYSLLIAASIPAAQLGIIPGTTHGLTQERPTLLHLLITEFLNSVERSTERSGR